MITLNERNGLKLEVDIYEAFVEPVLIVIDGKERIVVNYSSGELENDLNELMVNFDIVDNIDGAKELLNEVVDYIDNIGPHERITLKEKYAKDVVDLYNKVKFK